MSKPDRLLRLNQVLAIIPISKSGWWLGIRAGILPRPVKIGRASLWKYSDIQELIVTLDRNKHIKVSGAIASGQIDRASDTSQTSLTRGGIRS